MYYEDEDLQVMTVNQLENEWEQTYEEKTKQVQAILIRVFLEDLGMDIPENIDNIVSFCTKDIDETADKTDWHDGDVIIALRRFIEQSKVK